MHATQPFIRSATGPAGLNNELAAIIERNMTLGAAIDFYKSIWQFRLNIDPWHEATHQFDSASLMRLQNNIVEAEDSNGSAVSETRIMAMEDIVRYACSEHNPAAFTRAYSRDAYVQRVFNNFNMQNSRENFNRTLSWRIAQVRMQRGEMKGITRQELKIESEYETVILLKIARQMGIAAYNRIMPRDAGIPLPTDITQYGDVLANTDLNDKPFWFVESGTNQPYTSGVPRYFAPHFPSGSNGIENFQVFRKPNQKKLESIYDTVIPTLLKMKKDVGFSSHEVFKKLRMGDFYHAIELPKDYRSVCQGARQKHKSQLSLANR